MQVAQVQLSVVSDGVLQYKLDLIQSVRYRALASLVQHYNWDAYHEVKNRFAYQSDTAYNLILKRTTYPSCSEELIAGEQPRLIGFLSNSNISEVPSRTKFIAQKNCRVCGYVGMWSQLWSVASFSWQSFPTFQWFSPVKRLGQYFLSIFYLQFLICWHAFLQTLSKLLPFHKKPRNRLACLHRRIYLRQLQATIASYLRIVTIIHASKFLSSDSLRSKHFRRLFSPFGGIFAFCPREIKASAKKEGAGRGRGRERGG